MLKEVFHRLFLDIECNYVFGLHFLNALVGVIDLYLQSRNQRAIGDRAVWASDNWTTSVRGRCVVTYLHHGDVLK